MQNQHWSTVLWLCCLAAACGSPGEAASPQQPPAPPAVGPPPSASAPPAPSSAGPVASAPPPTPAENELAAFALAKPIFEAHCAACHTKKGSTSSKVAMTHFSMDTYPFGGHHADKITATLRKVLGAGGSKATMPRGKAGSVKGQELATLLAWASAFDVTHPAKDAAEPGHHHH